MRNVVFHVIPVTHGMDVFDGDLLVCCGIDERTVEKGEKLLLRSIDVYPVF